jgi:hypothetical protein
LGLIHGGICMFAIVYKSDGFPICRQVEGVSPDPVVTCDADFQAVAITDDAMDQIAKAMGCPVGSLMFDPYPG